MTLHYDFSHCDCLVAINRFSVLFAPQFRNYLCSECICRLLLTFQNDTFGTIVSCQTGYGGYATKVWHEGCPVNKFFVGHVTLSVYSRPKMSVSTLKIAELQRRKNSDIDVVVSLFRSQKCRRTPPKAWCYR